MAIPTPKDPMINKLIDAVTGGNRVEAIRNNRCNFCSKEATKFRNALSQKEFTISGLCQDCQDSVFGRD